MVRRTRNGAKFYDRTPCARGMPQALPHPKTSARSPPSQNRPAEKVQNGGCAIALVGGWGQLRPPDSELGETLRAASVCQKYGAGTAAPKNKSTKAPVPQPPAKNAQIEGWAIALVGGWGQLRPPYSEWAETLRAASVCPRDVPGTAAAKNECPKSTIPQPNSGKCPK